MCGLKVIFINLNFYFLLTYAHMNLVYNSKCWSIWNIKNHFYITRTGYEPVVQEEISEYNAHNYADPHLTIVFDVSHDCFLNCTYCFVKRLDTLNEKRKEYKLTDETINNLSSFVESLKKPVVLIFHGAEPLTNKDGIRKTIEVFESRNLKNVRFEIQTSGYGLDEEFSIFLHKKNVSIGLSFDGFGENCARNPNYAIRAMNVLEKLKIPFGIIYLINTTNDSKIFEDFKKLLNYKMFKGVLYNIVETDNLSLLPDLKNVRRNVELLIDYYLRKRLSITLDPVRLYAERILGRTGSLCYDENCGAFKWIIGFSMDGKIYGCDSVIGLEDFLMNSEDFQDNRKKILNLSKKISDTLECETCKFNYICRHPCVGKAYLFSFKSLKHSCEYNKIWLEIFFEYVTRNPALLFYFSKTFFKKYEHSDLFYKTPKRIS